MQSDLPSSSRGPQDGLTLRVWVGGDGAYDLYEDEGVGFGYEEGEFRHTPITSESGADCHIVTIGPGSKGTISRRAVSNSRMEPPRAYTSMPVKRTAARVL